MRASQYPRYLGLTALAFFIVGPLGCASVGESGNGEDGGWLAEKGFYDRSSWTSTALHLERADIVSAEGVTDLVLEASGITLQPGPRYTWSLVRTMGSPGDTCSLPVYLNGYVLEMRGSEYRFGLDSFLDVREVDAIELHFGPNGPVFDQRECGCILLWSLDRRTRNDPPFRGSIRGVVKSSAPDSVVDVRLDPGGFSTVPGPKGEFSFSNLRPDAYRLNLTTINGPVAQHWVRVFAYEESHVELNLGRRGPL